MKIHNNISQIDLMQWSDLIKGNSTASFFQTAECYHFYASLDFMKPFVFGVSENDKLVGVMCGYVIADGNVAKKFFSRRAIVPGGLANFSLYVHDGNIASVFCTFALNKGIFIYLY